MTTTPLAEATYVLSIVADSGYESTTEGRCNVQQYSAAVRALHDAAWAHEITQARADLEAENRRLRKIAWLIGSIFVHGNFKAETYNERELEKLLRENGTFWESLADFDARAALESKP